MKKIMKPASNNTSIKTVVVQIAIDNVKEYKIDTSIFDDPYMEAATRALEQISKHGSIKHLISCWDKADPNNTKSEYNTYHILVNASKYKKAELLREKFKMQYDADLKTAPYSTTKKVKI